MLWGSSDPADQAALRKLKNSSRDRLQLKRHREKFGDAPATPATFSLSDKIYETLPEKLDKAIEAGKPLTDAYLGLDKLPEGAVI